MAEVQQPQLTEIQKRQRAAVKAPPAELKLSGTVTETVTYLPGPDDPVQTKFAGHVFTANVPKTIAGDHDADPKTAAYRSAQLIETAKKNRFFKVGEFNASRDGVAVEEQNKPQTAEQYRAHAVAWLKTVDSVEKLDTKWIDEEPLRQQCEVGYDDIEYLRSLFVPKREELRKRDAAF